MVTKYKTNTHQAYSHQFLVYLLCVLLFSSLAHSTTHISDSLSTTPIKNNEMDSPAEMNRLNSAYGFASPDVDVMNAALIRQRTSSPQSLEELLQSSYQVFKELRLAHGLYSDRIDFRIGAVNTASLAVVGMGLISLCIADKLGLEENAADLVVETLRSMRGQTPGFSWEKNKKGYFHHWLNTVTQKHLDYSTYSSIDNGILVSGALFCKKYFSTNRLIGELADSLYRSIDWIAAIADPVSGEIYREMDEAGVGKPTALTKPFNEYMIVAWLAANYSTGNNKAKALWQNHYEYSRRLPVTQFNDTLKVLTDRSSEYLSNFVMQFPYFLCHHFTVDADYVSFLSNAMLADKAWWRQNTIAPNYIWGTGAGACPIGYCADNFKNNPYTICSPQIIAGFIPVNPGGLCDLQMLFDNSLGISQLTDKDKTRILWRFSYSQSDWKAQDCQGIDYSTMLFGLASHPAALGTSFFEKYNDFFSGITDQDQDIKEGYQGQDFRLYQNYPNPFNSSTRIDIEVDRASDVTLSIVNTNGQHIRSLMDGPLDSGKHTFFWDGLNENRNIVSSGIYLLYARSDFVVSVDKMLLIR
jgi:hypothetical protein